MVCLCVLWLRLCPRAPGSWGLSCCCCQRRRPASGRLLGVGKRRLAACPGPACLGWGVGGRFVGVGGECRLHTLSPGLPLTLLSALLHVRLMSPLFPFQSGGGDGWRGRGGRVAPPGCLGSSHDTPARVRRLSGLFPRSRSRACPGRLQLSICGRPCSWPRPCSLCRCVFSHQGPAHPSHPPTHPQPQGPHHRPACRTCGPQPMFLRPPPGRCNVCEQRSHKNPVT